MGYAEVSVNSLIAQRRTFSYAIPPGLSIDVGQAVWVPFGGKLLQGIVLELSDYPAVEETREITGVIDPHPLLSLAQVELARWISGDNPRIPILVRFAHSNSNKPPSIPPRVREPHDFPPCRHPDHRH